MSDSPLSKPEGRENVITPLPILVDGSNVAYGSGKKPLMGNLEIVLDELKRHHIQSITLIDSGLRHTIDQPQFLQNMIDGKTLIQVPAQRTADDSPSSSTANLQSAAGSCIF